MELGERGAQRDRVAVGIPVGVDLAISDAKASGTLRRRQRRLVVLRRTSRAPGRVVAVEGREVVALRNERLTAGLDRLGVRGQTLRPGQRDHVGAQQFDRVPVGLDRVDVAAEVASRQRGGETGRAFVGRTWLVRPRSRPGWPATTARGTPRQPPRRTAAAGVRRRSRARGARARRRLRPRWPPRAPRPGTRSPPTTAWLELGPPRRRGNDRSSAASTCPACAATT